MSRKTLAQWRKRAGELERETYAVYLALKDPRVPWYARAVAILVVGYAFSPIDLIPDIIPVLGYLDDLVIVPLGIALTLKLIPAEVMAGARTRAGQAFAEARPASRVAAAVIVVIWVLAALLVALVLARWVAGRAH